MGRYKSNIMITDQPYFVEFNCFRAPLLIVERDAWKRRYEYRSPMVPSEKFLYFTDPTLNITFIDGKEIESISVNWRDYFFILQKLVHSALKILFEDKMFVRYKGTYIHPTFKQEFSRLGVTYTIFNGVRPIVSFQGGYGIIKLPLESKIFLEVRGTVSQEWVVALCDICDKKHECENVKHKISRIQARKKRIIMLKDIDGLEFECPSEMVRIEARPQVMKGEYAAILTRTSLRTRDESALVSTILDMLSSNRGKIVLSFSEENQVPFYLLEG